MGLLMICPHCHTKLPLACRTCLSCGADLRYLAPEDRHYFIGEAGVPDTAGPPAVRVPGASLEGREVDGWETFPEYVKTVEAESQPPLPETPVLDGKDVSLCEALDRILNKGAVLFGEVMISVADIDLVYLGLQVILASMETARGLKPAFREGVVGPNLFDKGVY
jgi:gas vesicle structural protein